MSSPLRFSKDWVSDSVIVIAIAIDYQLDRGIHDVRDYAIEFGRVMLIVSGSHSADASLSEIWSGALSETVCVRVVSEIGWASAREVNGEACGGWWWVFGVHEGHLG